MGKRKKIPDPEFVLVDAIRRIVKRAYDRDSNPLTNPDLKAASILRSLREEYPDQDINEGSAKVAVVKVRREFNLVQRKSPQPLTSLAGGFSPAILMDAKKLVQSCGEDYNRARDAVSLLEALAHHEA